ncbi:MAG TPA: hypothetical protein VFV02_14070, partial [Acidimicrobiales bacterium]|nr:hypothetical protein [Acidimicrobiales bacterium]
MTEVIQIDLAGPVNGPNRSKYLRAPDSTEAARWTTLSDDQPSERYEPVRLESPIRGISYIQVIGGEFQLGQKCRPSTGDLLAQLRASATDRETA